MSTSAVRIMRYHNLSHANLVGLCWGTPYTTVYGGSMKCNETASMIRLLAKSALFLTVGLPIAVCGGMPVYSASPIEAWVVDAETSQPLEGVIVTANWQLVTGSLGGGEIPKGQLVVMESVTDKNGRLYFEGWTKTNFSTGELRNQDPYIVMFKPAYQFYGFLSNYSPGRVFLGLHRKSALGGQTIRLARFTGTLEAYADHLSAYDNLHNVVDDCEWKRIPRMILALSEERRRIKALNERLVVRVPDIPTLEGLSKRCGSAAGFFRAYKAPDK